MENTREKNKRADGRKKTYFDRENKKKAARTVFDVAPAYLCAADGAELRKHLL